MKIKNFTALVCMLFVAQLSFGQITFEHLYDTQHFYPIQKQYGDLLTHKYLMADQNTGNIIIYNLDHSIYKTIKPNIPNGYSIYLSYPLYINVVNSDPLIELYYSLKHSDIDGNNVYETYLINENNELIKKFDNTTQVRVIATEDGMKLEADVRIDKGNSIYRTEVYSLPTTLNNIPSLQSESRSLPYPNPAKQTITIPYQLSGQWGTISIYNASGQFVEQKNVDKNFSNLLLDVSGYAKGMYYYKVDKQKGEFMVN